MCFMMNNTSVLAYMLVLTMIIVKFTYLNVNAQNWALPKLIPSGYNKKEVPLDSGSGNANLTVNATIKINSFSANEQQQSISTNLFLCLNWTDYRLQSLILEPGSVKGLTNNSMHLHQVKLTSYDSLWKPIVNFRNSMSASPVKTLNNIDYMQVWPDLKVVRWCRRLSVSFTCRFELANFPFDEHYCHLELENFEKNAQNLRIVMSRMDSTKGNAKYRVRHLYKGECDPISYYPYANRGLKSLNSSSIRGNCAYGGVNLVRSINYYVIRYYCNTFLMVAVSFASFWMPTNAWPARIYLTATVMLSLITVSGQGYNEVPSNDVTSLAWWLWFCQFFIYMSMVEYAFSLAWVYMIMEKKLAIEENKPAPVGHYFGNKNCFQSCGNCVGAFIRFFFGKIDFGSDPTNRSKVDYFSRIFFPFTLLLFVLVYIVSTIPVWAKKYRW